MGVNFAVALIKHVNPVDSIDNWMTITVVGLFGAQRGRCGMPAASPCPIPTNEFWPLIPVGETKEPRVKNTETSTRPNVAFDRLAKTFRRRACPLRTLLFGVSGIRHSEPTRIHR